MFPRKNLSRDCDKPGLFNGLLADVAVSLVVSSVAGDRDSRNFEITVGSFPTVGTDHQ